MQKNQTLRLAKSIKKIGIVQKRVRFLDESLQDWLEYPQSEKFFKPPKTRKQSESSRYSDLEYDDMQPDEDGLTFSEYHNLEW
jgi:hypothetical protein